MIPKSALKKAVEGGYQWQSPTQRHVITCVGGWDIEWFPRLEVFIDGPARLTPRVKSWQQLAADWQFWECLCRALNRWDEKELSADFQRRMKRGQKGYAFWHRILGA